MCSLAQGIGALPPDCLLKYTPADSMTPQRGLGTLRSLDVATSVGEAISMTSNFGHVLSYLAS